MWTLTDKNDGKLTSRTVIIDVPENARVVALTLSGGEIPINVKGIRLEMKDPREAKEE